MIHLMLAVALTIPPAAKVLGVAVTVYGVIQYVLKNVPGIGKYIAGWKSVALNVVLSILGVVVALPADQLYTQQTLYAVITAALAAAGIHGTFQNQAPALLAQKPSDPKAPSS